MNNNSRRLRSGELPQKKKKNLKKIIILFPFFSLHISMKIRKKEIQFRFIKHFLYEIEMLGWLE
jgi:hypothetical protein